MGYLVLVLLAVNLVTLPAQPSTTLDELTEILMEFETARDEWSKGLDKVKKGLDTLRLAQATLATASATQSGALIDTTVRLNALETSFSDYKENVRETAMAEIQHLDSQVQKGRVTLFVLGGVAGAGLGVFSVKSFVDGDIPGGLIFAGLAAVDVFLIIMNIEP